MSSRLRHRTQNLRHEAGATVATPGPRPLNSKSAMCIPPHHFSECGTLASASRVPALAASASMAGDMIRDEGTSEGTHTFADLIRRSG